MSSQPRILFLSLFNDVGSDRIVSAMGRLGACCGVIGSADAFAASSRGTSRLFALPGFGGYWVRGLFLGARLARIAREWSPDLVIPLDELSARMLRDSRLHRKARPAVRALLERSLGAPAHFDAICSRHQLVDMAQMLGIDTPSQQAVDDLAAAKSVAAELGYPVVLKREQTCGGAGVTIVETEEGLARAFPRAARKAAIKRLVQRVLGLKTASLSPLVLQRFVAGPLAFRVVACANGEVLEGVSFQSECTHPAVTGASTMLRPIERADMDMATRKLVAALGCSGFVSVDFILPPAGEAVLIEMNPRPVASGHLGALYGHDIYRALLGYLQAMPATPEPARMPAMTVALFPRELDRDPRSANAASPANVFHDVPWDDPGAVAAYAAWLEQRHPADGAHLRRLLKVAPRLDHETEPKGAATGGDLIGRAFGRFHGPASVK